MIATKDEIIEALQGAVEETRGQKNVMVPVVFLEDLLELLTSERKVDQ